MTVFVGIDLAWSGRRPSGICVLEGDASNVRSRCVGTVCWPPERVFEWMGTLGRDVIAAVDAPLVIGERRRAEALMAMAYRGTGLQAYSARWDFLARHGIIAGPELGALLEANGWSLDPCAAALPGRRALEVFPHAVIVSLLGHPRLLQYKKGPRSARLEALSEFKALLSAYSEGCLRRVEGCPVTASLAVDAGRLQGPALKTHEDELDAIACALASYHFVRAGPDGMRVFGDGTEGYIAVPV